MVARSSSLADFVAAYVEAGRIRSKEDLVHKHPNLCSEIQLNWYCQAQVGCLFAVQLARKAISATGRGWSSVCVPELSPAAAGFGEFVSGTLDLAYHEKFEAAQILFPACETAEQIVELVNGLCRCDRFLADEIKWSGPGEPDYLLVGLRWRLPCGNCIAEAIGTASIKTMPPTRRTPFTSIVVRTQAQLRDPPTEFRAKGRRRHGECPAVHLADMDDQLGDQEGQRTARWRKTKKLAAKIVPAGMVETAKAKVSFSLPFSLRERLVASMERR